MAKGDEMMWWKVGRRNEGEESRWRRKKVEKKEERKEEEVKEVMW